MSTDLIKEKLEQIKKDNKFDPEFTDILLSSYLREETGEDIAKQVIAKIISRYVENK